MPSPNHNGEFFICIDGWDGAFVTFTIDKTYQTTKPMSPVIYDKVYTLIKKKIKGKTQGSLHHKALKILQRFGDEKIEEKIEIRKDMDIVLDDKQVILEVGDIVLY